MRLLAVLIAVVEDGRQEDGKSSRDVAENGGSHHQRKGETMDKIDERLIQASNAANDAGDLVAAFGFAHLVRAPEWDGVAELRWRRAVSSGVLPRGLTRIEHFAHYARPHLRRMHFARLYRAIREIVVDFDDETDPNDSREFAAAEAAHDAETDF